MTDGPIWPSISSELDATIAQLDRLQSTSQERRSTNLRRLEQIVAGLDGVTVDEPEPTAERRERPADRRAPTPDPVPFVALPQRTTHGGPFGPAVREKLISAALAKSRW